ncbi:MAG: hypothetical protein ACRDKH_09475 [Solirubrobacterales bacterium]
MTAVFGTKRLLVGSAAAAVVGGVIGALELPRNTGYAVGSLAIILILIALTIHTKLTTGVIPGRRSGG